MGIARDGQEIENKEIIYRVAEWETNNKLFEYIGPWNVKNEILYVTHWEKSFKNIFELMVKTYKSKFLSYDHLKDSWASMKDIFIMEGYNFFIKSTDWTVFVVDEDSILNEIEKETLRQILNIVEGLANKKEGKKGFKIKYELQEVLFKEDTKNRDDLYAQIWLKYEDENGDSQVKYVSWPWINLLKARKTKEEENLIRKTIVDYTDLLTITDKILEKYSSSKDFESFSSLIQRQWEEIETTSESSNKLCNSFTQLFVEYIQEHILKRSQKDLEKYSSKDLLENNWNEKSKKEVLELSEIFKEDFYLDFSKIETLKRFSNEEITRWLNQYLSIQIYYLEWSPKEQLVKLTEGTNGISYFIKEIQGVEDSEKEILSILNWKFNEDDVDYLRKILGISRILKKGKSVFLKDTQDSYYGVLFNSEEIECMLNEEEIKELTLNTEEEQKFFKLFKKFILEPSSINIKQFSEKDFDYVINFKNVKEINEDLLYTMNDFFAEVINIRDDNGENEEKLKHLKIQINAIRIFFEHETGKINNNLSVKSFLDNLKDPPDYFLNTFEFIWKAWDFYFWNTDEYTLFSAYKLQTDWNCQNFKIFLNHPESSYKSFWEYLKFLKEEKPQNNKLLKAPENYLKKDFSKAIQLLSKCEIAVLGNNFELNWKSFSITNGRDPSLSARLWNEESSIYDKDTKEFLLSDRDFTNALLESSLKKEISNGLNVKVNWILKYKDLNNNQKDINIDKEEKEVFNDLLIYLFEHPEKQKYANITSKPAFKNLYEFLVWKDSPYPNIYIESQFDKIQISQDIHLKKIFIPLEIIFYVDKISLRYEEGAIFLFENEKGEKFSTDYIELKNLEETSYITYTDLFWKDLINIDTFSEGFIQERINKLLFSLSDKNDSNQNEINLFSSYKLKTGKLDLINFIEKFSKEEKSLNSLNKVEKIQFKINLNYKPEVNQEQEGLITQFFWKEFIESLVKQVNNFSLDIEKSLNFLQKEIKRNNLFNNDFNFIFSTALAEILQMSWDPLKNKYIQFFTTNYDDDEDLEIISESLRIIIKQNNLEFCNKFLKIFMIEMNNQLYSSKESDFFTIAEFYLNKILKEYITKYNSIDLLKEIYIKYININENSILFLNVILKLKQEFNLEIETKELFLNYIRKISNEIKFNEFDNLNEIFEETIDLFFNSIKNKDSGEKQLEIIAELLNEANNLTLLKQLSKNIINLFRKNSLEINKIVLKNIFKFINFKGEIIWLEIEELKNLLFFNIEESYFKTINQLILELLEKTNINPESLFNFIETYKLRDFFENKGVETINFYTEFILKVKNKNFDGKENLAFKIIHQIFWKENVNTEQIMNKVAELWRNIFKISEDIQKKFLERKVEEDKNKTFMSSLKGLFGSKTKIEKLSSNKNLFNDLTVLLEEGIGKLDWLLKDLKKTKDIFENLETTTKNLKSQLSELNSFKEFFQKEDVFKQQFDFINFYNNNENKLINQSKEFYNLKIKLLEMDISEFEQELKISILKAKK